MGSKEQIKALVQTAQSLEKARVAMGNRNSALERGVDNAKAPIPEIFHTIMKAFEETERLIDVAVEEAISGNVVYNLWLRHIKGIGPHLAAQMLAFLLPPKDGLGVGTWFKACGLVPEKQADGKWRLPRTRKMRCIECRSTTFRTEKGIRICTECGRKLQPGEGKMQYHPYMRRCLYNVATSLVRVGGFYRIVYDDQKSRLVTAHVGDAAWPPYRLDSVARWITVRLLLSHLWHKWAEIEDVAIRPPYVIEVLGHTGYMPPPEWNGKDKI